MTERQPKPEYLEKARAVMAVHGYPPYLGPHTKAMCDHFALALEDAATEARACPQWLRPSVVEETAERLTGELVEARAAEQRLRQDRDECLGQVEEVEAALAEAQKEISHLKMHLKLCGDSNARLAQESLDEGDRAEKALASADRLQAQVERLAEAVRPFADVLKGNYSYQSDAMSLTFGHGPWDQRFACTVGDLRRAREALASISGDGDGWRPTAAPCAGCDGSGWVPYRRSDGAYGCPHCNRDERKPSPSATPPLPTKEPSNG